MFNNHASQPASTLNSLSFLSLVICLSVLWGNAALAHVSGAPDGCGQPAGPSRCEALAEGPYGVPGLNGPADEIGSWGEVMEWPAQATHATLLPTGKVLWWRNGGSSPYVWDPETEAPPEERPLAGDTNMFCGGHTMLTDGRVLAVGGTLENTNNLGSSDANIFDPVTETWSQVANMNFGRWYPTATALADGRVLVSAGSIRPACRDGASVPESADVAEVYDVESNTWTMLENARQVLPQYPYMHLLPDGDVFQAGPGRMTRKLSVDSQVWSSVGTANSASSIGSSVMYRPGKILKLGGSDPATSRAEVINLRRNVPLWREVEPMQFARRRPDAVLLPDGNTLAIGGAVCDQNLPAYAVHAAELWNPKTESWKTLASMQRPRIYHSTALLLPDGRVLTAGGENGDVPGGEANAQIFSPPYLFKKGPRPRIDRAPATIDYGERFRIRVSHGDEIASIALVRVGSVTHNFGQNQRYLRLRFWQRHSGRVRVRAPRNPNAAPPGVYMLFIVSQSGKPSLARFVTIRPSPHATYW